MLLLIFSYLVPKVCLRHFSLPFRIEIGLYKHLEKRGRLGERKVKAAPLAISCNSSKVGKPGRDLKVTIIYWMFLSILIKCT